MLTRYPVLLHGFTGASTSWGSGIVDGLASVGLAPVLVDLPGHGRHAAEVDPAGFTLRAALDLVSQAGDRPADLIGYSMGGRVALHFAAERPGSVRRLVLESASPGLATGAERSARREADESLASRIETRGVEAFIDTWERLPLFASQVSLPDHVRLSHRLHRLRNCESGLAGALRGLGTGALPSLWDRLPEIECPTLLLVGEHDAKVADVGARMASKIPRATLVVVPDAGHTVHLERPEAWLAAVGSFLAED
ncbi:MAG: 2-succinyl-6-hydroxy-2,4-cyclohexadiene-1-carboxylate synthase [Gemmatimonadetes bacterium]|nr:2-succinyl-6-hydroxy-2,4-cyclohexadiene-1-carboxylate synthase [Gemmatimonadota bacterium]